MDDVCHSAWNVGGKAPEEAQAHTTVEKVSHAAIIPLNQGLQKRDNGLVDLGNAGVVVQGTGTLQASRLNNPGHTACPHR